MNEKKWPRQPNQYRMRYSDKDLTEGAELLLSLISKYQYTHNVTTTQYAYLMGISRRNLIKYLNELIEKKKIRVLPETRKRGRGKANKYEVIDDSY